MIQLEGVLQLGGIEYQSDMFGFSSLNKRSVDSLGKQHLILIY